MNLDYDFCETFMFSRSEETLELDQYKKIFTKQLNPNNVIHYGPFSFFMIQKYFSEDENRMVIDSLDEDAELQVDKQLIERNKELCHNKIDDDYLKRSLIKAEFKFVIAAKEDYDKGIKCPIIAFRLIKELKTDLYYLKKFNMIESLLVCAIELSRTDKDLRTGRDIVLKSGLGSIITYKSVQFALNNKYDYYFMRSASVPLLRVYLQWGFHLGLPFLDLDYILTDFEEFFNVGSLEKQEEHLSNIIKYQIKYKLQKSHRLCKIVFGIGKGEWEDILENKKEDAFEFESNALKEFIVDKSSGTIAMFMDLHSFDIDTLYNYSLKKFSRYLTYNNYMSEIKEY